MKIQVLLFWKFLEFFPNNFDPWFVEFTGVEPMGWLSSQVSQIALMVKNLPVSAGDARDAVWSLGWEVPLEEEMATHSSILAWEIPWTEEPGGLQPRVAKSRAWLSRYTRTTVFTPIEKVQE